jgi:hypothetical protein
MRGGKTALAVVAFETAMMLALAGSYARAQTMGEYGATLNSAGVAAEQPGASGELAGAPPDAEAPSGSPIDRPSALDSGNDPLSEAPSYFGDSGNSNSAGGVTVNEGQPSQDSSGIPYAPSVQ